MSRQTPREPRGHQWLANVLAPSRLYITSSLNGPLDGNGTLLNHFRNREKAVIAFSQLPANTGIGRLKTARQSDVISVCNRLSCAHDPDMYIKDSPHQHGVFLR